MVCPSLRCNILAEFRGRRIQRTRCHSSGSSSPAYFVLAPVFLRGKQVAGNMDASYVLDFRLRGNDTVGLARQERGDLLHSSNCYSNCKATAHCRRNQQKNDRFRPLEPKESIRRQNATNSLLCNKLWQKTGISVYSLSNCYPSLNGALCRYLPGGNPRFTVAGANPLPPAWGVSWRAAPGLPGQRLREMFGPVDRAD